MDTVISFRAGLNITAVDLGKFPEVQGEIISLMLTAKTYDNATAIKSTNSSITTPSSIGKISIGELLEVLVNSPYYHYDQAIDRIIRIREVAYALKTLLRLGIVRHKVSVISKNLFISLESIVVDNNNDNFSSSNTFNESCKLSGLVDSTKQSKQLNDETF